MLYLLVILSEIHKIQRGKAELQNKYIEIFLVSGATFLGATYPPPAPSPHLCHSKLLPRQNPPPS